ncbi:hypothetical protein [Pyrobaculum sp.]
MRWLGLAPVVAALMLVVFAGARLEPPSGVDMPKGAVKYDFI